MGKYKVYVYEYNPFTSDSGYSLSHVYDCRFLSFSAAVKYCGKLAALLNSASSVTYKVCPYDITLVPPLELSIEFADTPF